MINMKIGLDNPLGGADANTTILNIWNATLLNQPLRMSCTQLLVAPCFRSCLQRFHRVRGTRSQSTCPNICTGITNHASRHTHVSMVFSHYKLRDPKHFLPRIWVFHILCLSDQAPLSIFGHDNPTSCRVKQELLLEQAHACCHSGMRTRAL